MKKYNSIIALAVLLSLSLMVGSCSLFGSSENARLRKELEELKKQKEGADKPAGPNAAAGEKTKRWVKMDSGYLTLRDAPDSKSGKLVAKMPNGAEVMVGGCKEQKIKIGGREGSWCEATYDGRDGWVFDAWLVKERNPKPKPAAPPKTETKAVPVFSDYAVSEVYSGKNHSLVLDDFGKDFKSRLTATIESGKPTFAGHYLVAGWGCGTSGCNTGAVIDAKTGRAYPFPVNISSVTVEDSNGELQDFQDHDYKLNSRLMIFSGNLEGSDHSDGEDVIEYYEFKDGKFVFIRSAPFGKKK